MQGLVGNFNSSILFWVTSHPQTNSHAGYSFLISTVTSSKKSPFNTTRLPLHVWPDNSPSLSTWNVHGGPIMINVSINSVATQIYLILFNAESCWILITWYLQLRMCLNSPPIVDNMSIKSIWAIEHMSHVSISTCLAHGFFDISHSKHKPSSFIYFLNIVPDN